MKINEHTAALISGGGSGLGAATARALAARGVKVALLDINPDAAAAVAAEIGGIAIRCDVTSADSAAQAVAEAAASNGPARIAVNCAGIAPPAKILGRDGPHDLDLFRRVIEVNLIGSFNMLRLAAAGMAGLDPVNDDGERGVIINTASVAAFEGQVGQAAYAVSKGGVHALTLPAARELARSGIRVATIAPGIFLTPMLLGLPQDAQDSLGKQVPFPSRLGKPDEYAALALHIIANSMINGETIRLDGAIRMAPR
ncbi:MULTISPECIES: SDR family NAD(P)-dependent oxidoreductase [unclassified Azospirillum]|uniref:SDR family NAD(P)-dependent oxidoreductase n=1 Tax=unclassified Azospirillum TaxID=2630922 RepID=UPI000B6B1CF9|nr:MULTISPECIES: SDR family NAD(P)-dependent oxidoreductase [unclassified Azospirillum]SNT14491.1 NAD(P)-dependent dehydrogenase, short-chain alcohol dehydrogenase family [Azospirillum sp. RU38E]SNT27720.1 NAD(P)-dependent dehydrogenase, short-chain alcohol dehydrogenase family [Azospirillum sp. RU37A]